MAIFPWFNTHFYSIFLSLLSQENIYVFANDCQTEDKCCSIKKEIKTPPVHRERKTQCFKNV